MVCKRRQAIPRQAPMRSGEGMAEMKLARSRQGYLKSGLVVVGFVEGDLLSFDPSLRGD